MASARTWCDEKVNNNSSKHRRSKAHQDQSEPSLITSLTSEQGFALNVSSSHFQPRRPLVHRNWRWFSFLIFRASHLETLTAHDSHLCLQRRKNATEHQERPRQAKKLRERKVLTILVITTLEFFLRKSGTPNFEGP